MRTISTKMSIVIVLSVMLGGCSNESSTSSSRSLLESVAKGEVFDVPSLFGRNIDAVGPTLGTVEFHDEFPSRKHEGVPDAEFSASYIKGGWAVLVFYDRTSRIVTEAQVSLASTKDESSSLTDEDKERFLIAGNLKATDPAYHLEYMPDPQKPGAFLGVRVVPNQVAAPPAPLPQPTPKPLRNVTCRISFDRTTFDAKGDIDVTYSLCNLPNNGAYATGTELRNCKTIQDRDTHTIPPTEKTYSVESGWYLNVRVKSGGLYEGDSGNVTISVLVDGKEMLLKQGSISATPGDEVRVNEFEIP